MASSRGNLLGAGETPAQYFDRFDNTWEPDPDRPGLVRRKDPEINHDDIDDESFEERRVEWRRSNSPVRYKNYLARGAATGHVQLHLIIRIISR